VSSALRCPHRQESRVKMSRTRVWTVSQVGKFLEADKLITLRLKVVINRRLK